ncbi:cytoplasmic tRNA 2-thiolation protein 2 [Karstenula rhodostoma CBS 690.94]|uniref:Cytoplasmic tRNA 2-thiolation protein 2 n=1 Tax=Karstenula rhodostoma CBS 690.94 TaxID=1392251 RepID=A0A9P4U601_9PLEO|nr:cytoplasmic tRNA 2-thiolation protein 2 [Karstenula rhodostoma CBS 690.94]
MPGKHIADVAEQLCRRCKESQAVLVVRRDPLCRDCFVRYVHTKVIKHMESFRVRNAHPNRQRKLLLALSLGASSVTLLHILDHLLETQTSKSGRTGFGLSVVLVGTENDASHQDRLAKVRQAYPDYEIASLPLHDVFRLVSNQGSLSGLLPETATAAELSPADKLASLFGSLTSATARADVVTTLRTRLVVEYARSSGCEGVLWGDSTTKLAEKTLAETAKGRGFALPWHVADGETPFGLSFNYPLRDILKKELVAYVDIVGSPLPSLVLDSAPTQASMSSKNTTIDDLMKQYFESVEENFPSIVSNVVRTTGKLEATSTTNDTSICDLCSMPVSDGRFGIHGWGGDQHGVAVPVRASSERRLCYGCTRSIPPLLNPTNGST